jgi:hypothetical protein
MLFLLEAESGRTQIVLQVRREVQYRGLASWTMRTRS